MSAAILPLLLETVMQSTEALLMRREAFAATIKAKHPREAATEDMGSRLLETARRLRPGDPDIKLSEVGHLLGYW